MNKDNFTKEAINIFCNYYKYTIEEFHSKRKGEYFWGVAKSSENISEYMIFLDFDEVNNVDIDYLYRSNKYENIRIIKVLYIDGREDINLNNILREAREEIILIDKRKEKVVYYSQFARENAIIIERIIEHINRIRKSENDRKMSIITTVLILTNIIMFLLTAYLSGSIMTIDTGVLVQLGAKENSLIASGEYYRLVSSVFLHGGIVHLAFNMYALFSLGPIVEKGFGKIKYILIYFIGGIASALTSYIFSEAVSIGASGAIFALLGAILVYNLKNVRKANKAMIGNIISVIITNIAIGFVLPNIDNFAHIGGLLAGIIISALLYPLKLKRNK